MTEIGRGGRIADPVHGYVEFTGIERVLLDHPVAQRLRYVGQNGLAHLVYPEATTSRFSHSLGAMHLASQFFGFAMRNTDPESRRDVGRAIGEAIRMCSGEVADPDASGRSFDSEPLIAHHYCEDSHAPHVLLAEQALRLAALFHDLGHLPFSHDFEAGLEQYWDDLSPSEKDDSGLRRILEQRRGQIQIHEKIGHELALLLLREAFSDVTEAQANEAVRISFECARRILESLESPGPEIGDDALQWFHSLVDGDLDVDRCDYILRDARNHGFEFATYDLARLLDNLVVTREDQRIVSAVRPHGLSAVESFLVSRFRSFQYGVRHHKVAQVGAALRHSVARVLNEGGDESITQFKNDLATLADAPNVLADHRSELLTRFASYDDVWWLGLMRNLAVEAPDEWLDLICWRKRGPRSLWKRIGDFPRELPEWNARLPEPSDLDAENRWADELKALRAEGVLVMRHYFSPWKPSPGSRDESELSVRQESGVLSPLSALSPMTSSLRETWLNDIQVQAFVTSDSSMSAGDVIERLSSAMSA